MKTKLDAMLADRTNIKLKLFALRCAFGLAVALTLDYLPDRTIRWEAVCLDLVGVPLILYIYDRLVFRGR